jgi:hypothetical protein
MNDTIAVGTTYQSLSVPAGWTCITPAVGGTDTDFVGAQMHTLRMKRQGRF